MIKKMNKYSVIASVCFLIYDVLLFICKSANIVEILLILGMTITLLTKNKIAVAIMIGLNILSWILFLGNINRILLLVTWVTTLVIVLLAINGNEVINKIWFVPGIVCLLDSIGYVFTYYSPSYGIVNYGISVTMLVLVRSLPIVAGFVFIGLWLKDETKDIKIKQGLLQNQRKSTENIIGGADRLKTYKELLDIGAITQEEFDIKKKQILDLKEK